MSRRRQNHPVTPDDRRTAHVTILASERGGRYPDGRSLLIAGSDGTLIVDPSLSVSSRGDDLPRGKRPLNRGRGGKSAVWRTTAAGERHDRVHAVILAYEMGLVRPGLD
jgi:hypothetical protein